jgi:DEAD/DEAH box helicase domain-containing protein
MATPSASGKSLVYNLAVLEAILKERASRALYLFPTKALAQDQGRALGELAQLHLLKPQDSATFDGDTPIPERAEIKRRARIVLTNPDMLHLGILPNHTSWPRLFRNLRYVVVDEAHAYRGVFGSHVAQVMRRLRRLCALYGSRPQFVLSSATLANPGEHARRLVGLEFEVVTDDGSPHGGKEFVFWNPPLIDEAKTARRSANTEASLLLTQLMASGTRSLAFARTRKLTELIYMYSRDRLAETDPTLARRIKPYRAGYLPQERRQIEQELFQGQLLGVVATTALELGVDIGDLEATILTGYPGSIASTWQQAGRSGRGGEGSLSFLIGLNSPLDQYLMRHPEAFFGKGFEHALINPDNPRILKPHLLCAAWEMPLKEGDEEFFGPGLREALGEMEEAGSLKDRGGRLYLSPSIGYPAQDIGIRSMAQRDYAVIDASRGSLLETVDGATAFFHIHPGAIYLHQGEAYLIRELDISSRTAYAVLTDAHYYTQTKDLTDLRVLEVADSKGVGGVMAYLGDVEVTTEVIGFKKKMQFTEEVIGEEALDLPPQVFPTRAFWFDLPPEMEARLTRLGLDLPGGLHAAEHAAIGLLPLFALCDRNDIGGVSTPMHADTGRAQVFIYDAHPGGMGIAEKGYELIEDLWRATLALVSECPCQEGCPSCVQSPKCGNNNQPLDKKAARVILGELVGLGVV